MASRLGTRLRACAIAAACVAAAPATAQAGTLGVSGGVRTFTAAPREVNNLSIERLSSGQFRVTDSGARLTAGSSGCTVSTTNLRQATCPAAGVTRWDVRLGDQDDRARMTGATPGRFFGGDGSDELTGGGGADRLEVQKGRDQRASGGDGADTLVAAGSSGLFTAGGGAGGDTIDAGLHHGGLRADGGPGNDAIQGFRGASDQCAICGASAQLAGGEGNDTLRGSSGPDLLTGGPGADTMAGGAGTDTASYGDRDAAVTASLDGVRNDGNATDLSGGLRDLIGSDVERITGTAGGDTLTGGPRDDGLAGGPGGDTLNGGGGDDELCGDAVYYSGFSFSGCESQFATGDDVLDGGAGDDVLGGGPGADTLRGGSGLHDLATWNDVGASDQAVVATLDGTRNDGRDLDPTTTAHDPEGDLVRSDVEGLGGGAGPDVLVGSGAANVLIGGGGGDDLRGHSGADVLCGDTWLVSGGFRTLFEDRSATALCILQVAGSGSDLLNGGAGDDLLLGGLGGDQLTGGTEADTASWADRTDPTAHSMTIEDACTPAPCNAVNNDGSVDDPGVAGDQAEHDRLALDVENVIGSQGPDTIVGSAGTNVLVGGGGADRLDGKAGDDVLEPFDYLFFASADVVRGGPGVDRASFHSACHADCSSGVQVSLNGVADDGPPFAPVANILPDVEVLAGTEGSDTLTAQTGDVDNTLLGYGGDDALLGNDGADVLDGGDGQDTLGGGDGADFLNSFDGSPLADTNRCGTGGDRVLRDAIDTTDPDCEVVHTGSAAAGAREEDDAEARADAVARLVPSVSAEAVQALLARLR